MNDSLAALSVDYGIQCAAADEKELVKKVNAFLASLNYRKMYKMEDVSVKPPGRAYRIFHYHCQFLKTHPRWYFDLRPNVDLDGKIRFPEHVDCGWTLFTHKPFPETYSTVDHEALDGFFQQLVGGMGFPPGSSTFIKRGKIDFETTGERRADSESF